MPKKNAILLITISLFLILLTFTAYQSVLSHKFLLTWDDHSYLANTPQLQSVTPENVYWMFTTFKMANWHPFQWLSFAMDFAAYGDNSSGFHLTNLIFHCLNVVLWFLLAYRLLLIASPTLNTYEAMGGAFIAALLLAIHPQHVESVAWVSERKDVLFLFFLLLCFHSYVSYARAEVAHQTRHYIITLLAASFSLMSKPMPITVGVLLLLLDIYPLRRSFLTPTTAVSNLRLIVEKIPFLILGFAVALMTLFAQYQSGAVAELHELSLIERILNASQSYIHYLSKAVFPILFLPLYPFKTDLPLYPLLIIVIMTILTLYQAWKFQRYAFLTAWLFYLISALPIIGILQVGMQAAADRYAYLPLLAIYLLIGGLLIQHWQRYRWLKLGGVIAVTLLLWNLTAQQTLIWRDDLTLRRYNDAFIDPTPSLKIPLGMAYLNAGYHQQAIKELELSNQITANINSECPLVLAYLAEQRWEDYRAMWQTCFSKMLVTPKLPMQFDEIYFYQALIMAKQNQPDTAKALANIALTFNLENKNALGLLEALK